MIETDNARDELTTSDLVNIKMSTSFMEVNAMYDRNRRRRSRLPTPVISLGNFRGKEKERMIPAYKDYGKSHSNGNAIEVNGSALARETGMDPELLPESRTVFPIRKYTGRYQLIIDSFPSSEVEVGLRRLD